MVIDQDGEQIVLSFEQWFEEQLLRGKSLRTIAKPLKVAHVTLFRHIEQSEKLQEIRNSVSKRWAELLKERAVELSLDDKSNTTLLIFLLKAISGLSDQPGESEAPPQTNLVPSMTKDQAREYIQKLRDSTRVSEKS